MALWNGKDPILKERSFGLTNSEGNHGEDVKEYYFYLDSTPTHSYMKYLYKYPQAAYPVQRSDPRRTAGATASDMEYELLDTGIFNEDRYFDVFVEYAKQRPEDMLIQISVCNRGPGSRHVTCAADAVVPQHLDMVARHAEAVLAAGRGARTASRQLPHRTPNWVNDICTAREMHALLFTENETNNERIFGTPNAGAVRQGRNQQLRGRRASKRRSIPKDRDQGRCTLSG